MIIAAALFGDEGTPQLTIYQYDADGKEKPALVLITRREKLFIGDHPKHSVKSGHDHANQLPLPLGRRKFFVGNAPACRSIE